MGTLQTGVESRFKKEHTDEMSTDAAIDLGPVRFGESFELDLAARQLRRYGQPVRLERIPLEILILLVQKRGEIIPREQIIASVWGAGTYLDTDNAINGAIRKIRQVLKDDPEQPKYIQTVTSKGYKFIAEVQARQSPLLHPAEQVPVKEPKTGRSKFVAAMIGIAVVIIAGVVYFATSRSRVRVEPAQGKYMLAVLPFENLTGDPTQDYFSDGLTEEMISHLGNLDPDHLGAGDVGVRSRQRQGDRVDDKRGLP